VSNISRNSLPGSSAAEEANGFVVHVLPIVDVGVSVVNELAPRKGPLVAAEVAGDVVELQRVEVNVGQSRANEGLSELSGEGLLHVKRSKH